MEENLQNESGHVYYFEPNDGDFGKDQDGQNVSLMPHKVFPILF